MFIDRQCPKSCKTELATTSRLYTIYNLQYSMLPSGSTYKAAHQEPGVESRAGPAGPVLASITGYLAPQRQNATGNFLT